MKKITKTFALTLAVSLIFGGMVMSCSSTKVSGTNVQDTAATPSQTDLVAENPITLTINIPAKTLNVNIQRRQVTKNGDSFSPTDGKDWETVGTHWIGTDGSDYSKEKQKTFTDIYGVKSGKCYEYRAVLNLGGSEDTYTNLGYHKADYYGALFPKFASEKPKIVWDEASKTLSLANASELEFKCFNNENIVWWNLNLSYGWSWWPYINNRETSYKMSDAEYKNLKHGNNILTSFSIIFNTSNENYFQYQQNFNVETEIDFNKIACSITGPIEAPTSGKVGITFDVTTPLPTKTIQTHIFRKLSTEDESKYKEIGFIDNAFYSKQFTDYYYEKGKTYDYMVRFYYGWEENENIYLDLGQVTTSSAGWKEPSYNQAPAFEYDSANKTLILTNKPSIKIPDSADSIWGNYKWEIVFGYKFFAKKGGGFWPIYSFSKNNKCNNTSVALDDWALETLSDSALENLLTECLIRIYEGDKIAQTIILYQSKYENGYEDIGTYPDWSKNIRYLKK